MGWTCWTRLILLQAVRLALSLGPGYIHPDEVFQGPEVVLGAVAGVQALVPWEFGPSPLRSAAPMYVGWGGVK